MRLKKCIISLKFFFIMFAIFRKHQSATFDYTRILPDEMLFVIFQKLKPKELIPLSLVCRRWRAISDDSTLCGRQLIRESMEIFMYHAIFREERIFHSVQTKALDLTILYLNFVLKQKDMNDLRSKMIPLWKYDFNGDCNVGQLASNLTIKNFLTAANSKGNSESNLLKAKITFFQQAESLYKRLSLCLFKKTLSKSQFNRIIDVILWSSPNDYHFFAHQYLSQISKQLPWNRSSVCLNTKVSFSWSIAEASLKDGIESGRIKTFTFDQTTTLPPLHVFAHPKFQKLNIFYHIDKVSVKNEVKKLKKLVKRRNKMMRKQKLKDPDILTLKIFCSPSLKGRKKFTHLNQLKNCKLTISDFLLESDLFG